MAGELIRRARELTESEDYDKARGIILTAVSAVPVIGSPMASALTEYLPNWKLVRVQEFLAELAACVDKLQQSLDAEKAKSEEYGLLLEHVLNQAARTTTNNKAEAYRAVLLNACLPGSPDKLEQEYMVSLLDRLREIHVVLLAVFRDPYAFAKHHGVGPADGQLKHLGTLRDCAQEIMVYLAPLQLPEELVLGAMHDLEVMGVLSDFADPRNTNVKANRHITSHLKGFGRRFADFIALPD